MPFPARLGRGKEMGRGPYEKSGLLRETSLPPGGRIHEQFEITYPFAEVTKGNVTQRELVKDQLKASVKLWYLPFGEFDSSAVTWFAADKDLDLKTEWVWH